MHHRRLHKFYLSFKVEREVRTVWVEGLNLRHAKDRLAMTEPEAIDIIDWTSESPEKLENYLSKIGNYFEYTQGAIAQ
ncbi:hypothetical protein [Persicobacter sp. CCB-QB2]|uniref:hypothetical protein n=1 Tax=Persicobacter sp. CCB-QB2 TaxID=1561025 RepID=UPI0006A9A593|nr:hypothetical protein [Persicobacter sp. CCB-QB2]